VKLGVILFALDLELIFDQVADSWGKVADDVSAINKVNNNNIEEQQPMLIAGAVTATPFRTIDQLFAAFQVKFPAVKTANDFITGLGREYLSVGIIGKCGVSDLYEEMVGIMNLLNRS